jgi:hypothetical protein
VPSSRRRGGEQDGGACAAETAAEVAGHGGGRATQYQRSSQPAYPECSGPHQTQSTVPWLATLHLIPVIGLFVAKHIQYIFISLWTVNTRH